MMYYAIEILGLLVLIVAAFLLYRILINSSRFTRFIERTLGTTETEIGDINIRINEAKVDGRRVAREIRERSLREARAARRLEDEL